LYLVNQQFENRVCLVHSSDADASRGKDFAVVDSGKPVADKNQAGRDAFCYYFVTFAIAGKTAYGNNFNATHFCQYRFDNHLFGRGAVETLRDTIGVGENSRYIVGGEGYGVPQDFDARVNSPEVLDHTIDLRSSNLVDEELLPVEVALLDVVEVGDYELSDACAGKSDGNVGAKPAKAGNAYD
jgi:hypothetical protein